MQFLGILPEDTTLGSRAGGDIGKLLQGLAQQKARKYQQGLTERALQAQNIEPRVAKWLSYQSPEQIQKFLSGFQGLDIGNQTEQAPQQSEQGMEGTPQSFQPQEEGPVEMGYEPRAAITKPNIPGVDQQVPTQRKGSGIVSKSGAGGFKEINPIKLAMDERKLQLDEENKRINNELKELKFKEAKIARQDKKFGSIIERVANESRVASEVEILLEQLKELNEEIGDWTPLKEGITQGIYNKTSLDFRSQAGKDAERFRKKAAEIINKGTSVIKGVATNFKVKNLQDSLPSLAQSQAGRREIIDDAIKLQQAMQVGAQELQKIRDENDGELPENLLEVLTQRENREKRNILTGGKFNEEAFNQPIATRTDAIKQARALGLEKFYLTNNETGKDELFEFDQNGKPKRVK